ncbi:hypothetical protein ACIBL3_08920 [Kribbella sp. NPDC050124]|uniref:hypothetical protein n=1 Tax=Kribbella sp. NPDC050124 TaxID=3364114 RepID=UPI00378B94D5
MNLDDELRALGQSAVVPPVDDGLTAAVLTRVADMPIRRSLRDRWRTFLALFLVLVAGAVATPPVRATVAEWLNIGGVRAQPVASAPTSAPTLPSVTGQLSLAEAQRIAGFKPGVPAELGAPAGVEASPGFVAVGWTGVRLEQFRAEVSPLYVKKYYSSLQEVTELNGYWFDGPHELVLEEATGTERRVRVAGPTLVWVDSGVTFRLEGVADKERAIRLAQGTS